MDHIRNIIFIFDTPVYDILTFYVPEGERNPYLEKPRIKKPSTDIF